MSGARSGGLELPWSAPDWDVGARILTPPQRPLVMGILNLTPDSFYAGSRRQDTAAAVTRAQQMIAAGADILDLGAESSRPGAQRVSAAEETARLLPVVAALADTTEIPLSIDTVRADVAEAALAAGATVINDISGGGDPAMFTVVAEHKCGLVLMHMQGQPNTMQADPVYGDVVAEISVWLTGRAAQATAAGISPARILLDPGLGFGKTAVHNLQLLGRLRDATGGRPHLLGASRKRFIAAVTGAEVEDRLAGSLAALSAAWAAGTSVVRVHDVAASVQFLEILRAISTGDVHSG